MSLCSAPPISGDLRSVLFVLLLKMAKALPMLPSTPDCFSTILSMIPKWSKVKEGKEVGGGERERGKSPSLAVDLNLPEVLCVWVWV